MDTEKMINIGEIWPGWEAKAYIGEGAFGKVYKIVRKEFDHTYESALKVITIPASKGELTTYLNSGFDEKSATLFFRGMVEDIVKEFVLMSKLRGNSNIVSYEDHTVIPREDGVGWDIYLRMELLTPLYDYMKEHPFTVQDVIQIGIDICQALEVCQKYQIIHRDIKPENIFVSDLGKYKLGDFGIARKLEKTSSGLSKKGTYSFMAPEVYKGEDYNASVDLYSLGLVLYRFLNNNRNPFLPPFPETIHYTDPEKANEKRFRGETFPVPCNADERLTEIILKACAYNPKERYQSPRALREALQEALELEREITFISPEEERSEAKGESMDAFAADGGGKDPNSIEFLSLEEIEGNGSGAGEKTQGLFGQPALTCSSAESSNDGAKDELDGDGAAEMESAISEQPPAEKEARAGGESAVSEGKSEGSSEHQKKKFKRILAAAGAFVCVILLAVFLIQGKRGITVPDLRDKTYEEAESIAKESGFTLQKSGESYSDTAAWGHIIFQDAEAGTEIKKNSVISVEISLGKEPVKVPKVTELTKEEAGKILEKAGISWKYGEDIYSDTVEAGVIISQSPKAGETLGAENGVVLIVSKGKELAQVPNVIGETEKKAKKSLKAAGLKVKVKEEEGYNETAAAGIVVGQSVNGGESAVPGTKVEIVISKGPKPEEEPEATPEPTPTPKSKSSSQPSYNPPAQEPQQPSEPAVPQEQPEPQPPAAPQEPQQPTIDPDEESIDQWDLIN